MTMADWLANAPTDYKVLIKNMPDHWEASQRVIDPLIRLHREDECFRLSLAGQRTQRGRTEIWYALSPDHNWVADSNIIRPLPHDTPLLVKEIIAGKNYNNLEFADVIKLLRLDDTDIPIEADSNIFVPAKDAARNFNADFEIPGLNAKLFPYQANGVAWMLRTLRHTGGVILADEMGLGKTIQIISLLLSEKPDEQTPALIICPTSLIANWRKEILRFAPELSLLIHRGIHRTGVTRGLQRAQIVLATYETVVNDLAIFSGLTWKWLICDEAQALKNPDSNRRQHIATLSRKFTVPMTGTPVETSLLDLWSLTDLAIPHLLGDRKCFENDFPDTEVAARKLARLTDPVILRRKVRDVAGDLPDKIQIDVPLELDEQLCERYSEVLRETVRKYPVAGSLVATGQLQLFCAHPWLQGSADIDENEDAMIVKPLDIPLVTPKVERTISILEEAFSMGKRFFSLRFLTGAVT